MASMIAGDGCARRGGGALRVAVAVTIGPRRDSRWRSRLSTRRSRVRAAHAARGAAAGRRRDSAWLRVDRGGHGRAAHRQGQGRAGACLRGPSGADLRPLKASVPVGGQHEVHPAGRGQQAERTLTARTTRPAGGIGSQDARGKTQSDQVAAPAGSPPWRARPEHGRTRGLSSAGTRRRSPHGPER